MDALTSPFQLDITEDLVPAQPRKLAGQTSLSFVGILDPPLILHEDLKEGCGGQLWPAGMHLAQYLLERTSELKGKIMFVLLSQNADVKATELTDGSLELGAGSGLVG